MEYPKLRTAAASRQVIDTFGGYNHSLRIGDNEFFDMQNMCSDYYPVFSPRKKRGLHVTGTAPEAMIYKDQLFYIDSGYVYRSDGFADADYVLETNPERRQMVSIGAYVVILPEKRWFNSAVYNKGATIPAKYRYGSCDARWEYFYDENDVVEFLPCKVDGTTYADGKITQHDKAPENPEDGDLWIDTSGETPVMKQWVQNGDTGMWQTILTNYVRIDATGIGKEFEQYDGIEISGLTQEQLTSLNGSNVIWAKDDNYIVVSGLLASSSPTLQSEKITVKREMPKMDFVVECGNRLWGCRYGENDKGEFVNVIYGSKLGDFKNWHCFMGISTDSTEIHLGSDGPFTGAINYMGHPVFFKENVLHKVYVSSTGAHSVVDTACQGVQRECGKSLSIVGDLLFYKSRSAIMTYDGSVPVALPSVFGDKQYKNAAAGACGKKYYISMEEVSGDWNLFVYDTGKGLWHREDDLQVTQFATTEDKLFAIAGQEILLLSGNEKDAEDSVRWFVQSGEIGIYTPDRKYLSRLNVRMMLAEDAEVSVMVRYDFEEEWRQLCSITGTRMRSVDIPVRPMRCDHMELRIEGVGDVKVYSITKTIEEGSDL